MLWCSPEAPAAWEPLQGLQTAATSQGSTLREKQGPHPQSTHSFPGSSLAVPLGWEGHTTTITWRQENKVIAGQAWDGARLFPSLVFYKSLAESWKLTPSLSPASFFPDPLLQPGSLSGLQLCPCVVSTWLGPGLAEGLAFCIPERESSRPI